MHGGQENICGVLRNECQQTGNWGTGYSMCEDVVFTSSATENKVKIQEKIRKENLAVGIKINVVVPLQSAWLPAAVTAAKGARSSGGSSGIEECGISCPEKTPVPTLQFTGGWQFEK